MRKKIKKFGIVLVALLSITAIGVVAAEELNGSEQTLPSGDNAYADKVSISENAEYLRTTAMNISSADDANVSEYELSLLVVNSSSSDKDIQNLTSSDINNTLSHTFTDSAGTTNDFDVNQSSVTSETFVVAVKALDGSGTVIDVTNAELSTSELTEGSGGVIGGIPYVSETSDIMKGGFIIVVVGLGLIIGFRRE